MRIAGCDPLAVGVSYQPIVDLLKSLFDIEDGDAPAQVAVRGKTITSLTRVLAGQPEPVYGAVVPVWVTINVPVDAVGGDYGNMGAIAVERELERKRIVTSVLSLHGSLGGPIQGFVDGREYRQAGEARLSQREPTLSLGASIDVREGPS